VAPRYSHQCHPPPHSGYEPLLRSIVRVTTRDIERLAERLTLAGDVRDVLNARDSLARLLGLRQFEDQ
jgi:hypothetical protein